MGLVVRYRKAVSYGMHALMAALETAGADCTVTLGGTAQECAGLITASRSDVVLVLWSFYSPDAEAMAADLAELGARIHAHTFMPLPGTPWRDASPAFIPLETMRDLDRLALQGALLRALAQAGRALGPAGRDGAGLPAPYPAPAHRGLAERPAQPC